jgi:2-oxoglutarate ferredoxin oxidoreductase subunit alpha
MDAFDLADNYRTPAMILADGMMGQMMEPVVFKEPKRRQYPERYMLKGAGEGKSRFIKGLILDQSDMEEHNWKLDRKYQVIMKNETRFEVYRAEDAELMIVAYGTAARIAKGAVKRLGDSNLKVGLFRPITLWPYPSSELREFSRKIKNFIVFEMSTGQMLEDVRLALQGFADIDFYGRPGGVVPTPAELANVIIHRYKKSSKKKELC